MLYLLGGFAVLGGFLLLVYLFVNADPARLARGLKVGGIVIAVAAVAMLAVSGRLAALLMPLAMLMPLLIRVRHILDRYRPPAGSQSSTVATAFLRMTLDHDTGRMEGTVLRGRFRRHAPRRARAGRAPRIVARVPGRRRGGGAAARSLSRPRAPGLARRAGGRRRRRRVAGGGGSARPASGDMTVEEAYAILGLDAGGRRRGNQGGAPTPDGQIASRSRRLRLPRDQDQPRPRRAAAPLNGPYPQTPIHPARSLSSGRALRGPVGAGSPLSRNAGEGTGRREAGEGPSNAIEVGVAIGKAEIGGVSEPCGLAMSGTSTLRDPRRLVDPVEAAITHRYRCRRAFDERGARTGGYCREQQDDEG